MAINYRGGDTFLSNSKGGEEKIGNTYHTPALGYPKFHCYLPNKHSNLIDLHKAIEVPQLTNGYNVAYLSIGIGLGVELAT